MIEQLKSKNLSSLDAYSQEIGSKIDTVNFVTFQTNNISGLGYEPVFNIYSKAGQLNKLEGPVKGESGVYVLSVVKKEEDNKEFDAEAEKAKLSQATYYLMMQSISALVEKMEVVDNRVYVYM